MKLKKLLFCLLAAAVVQLLTGALDSDSTVFASSTVFEIPLGDLKKVEKRKQYKSEKRKKREYKNTSKTDAEKSVSSVPAAVPDVTEKSQEPVKSNESGMPLASAAPADKPAPQLSPPITPQPAPEPQLQPVEASKPSVPAEPAVITNQTAVPSEPATLKIVEKVIIPSLPVTEEISRISHEPYSYLVAGKLTSLMAVVISKNNVKSMHCRFRAKKDGQYAEVEMSLVPGSKFTYNAVIPALIPGSAALNYQFVMTETQGEKVLSPEYQIPLGETVVVPGWQQELGRTRINVSLDNSSQPFEGFIGLSSK